MWKCPKCNSEIEEDDVVNCWSCDYSKVSPGMTDQAIGNEETIKEHNGVKSLSSILNPL
jgi:hypothetical protein